MINLVTSADVPWHLKLDVTDHSIQEADYIKLDKKLLSLTYYLTSKVCL